MLDREGVIHTIHAVDSSMSMLDLALSYIGRGWHVFPCWPESKKPMTPHGWKDAANDEETVRAWWAKTPQANIGIACNPSNLAVLDVDHGIADADALQSFLDATGLSGLPNTYAVRTGRRPEFGIQIYFQGTMPDVGLWKLGGCEGQIKSAGGYVMAAGSIHPDSHEAYAVVCDSEPISIPEIVRGLKTEHVVCVAF